ncbi:MAG: hypothetical protein IPL42_01420 [Saprospiraceae bacterium]|nr:hypothetical protein [Saprospiraceae bacterium]
MLIIVSEIITDFQEVLMYLRNESQKKIRTLMTPPKKYQTFNLQDLFAYINNIAKHKIASFDTRAGMRNLFKYHEVNHHIRYYFKDSKLRKPKNTININNLSVVSKRTSYLEIMRLNEIIFQVLCCYVALDWELENNKHFVNKMRIFEKRVRSR